MFWFFENILIPIIISLVFMWHGRIYIKRINRHNSFKKYIKKIKNLLILSSHGNFNEDKEAEITLAIDNLLSKLSIKNIEEKESVKEKLGCVRRSLPTLSKNIKEQSYQKTSALMIENLSDVLEKTKRKYF
jgi:hypothetical protein